MGYYITCIICGEEFKNCLSCDCAQKEAKKWIDIWVGRKVIAHKIVYKSLYYHIEKEGESHYFSMHINDEGSSYNKISQEQFENCDSFEEEHEFQLEESTTLNDCCENRLNIERVDDELGKCNICGTVQQYESESEEDF